MPNLNFGCFSLTVGNPPWMSFLKNLLDFFFVVSRICRQISDVVAVERIRFWLFLFLFRRFFSLARAWASGEGRLRFGSGLDFSRIRHWSKICRQNSKQTFLQENLLKVFNKLYIFEASHILSTFLIFILSISTNNDFDEQFTKFLLE